MTRHQQTLEGAEKMKPLREGNAVAAVALIGLLLALAPHAGAIFSHAQQASVSCSIEELTVHDDGSIEVNATLAIQAQEYPANITFEALAPPVFAQAIDLSTGALLPTVFNGKNITITVFNTTTIKLYYVTLQLTNKQGQYWTLNYTSPCKTILILPQDAVPVAITPGPTPILYQGKPALEFPPGQVKIKYMIVPLPQQTTTTTTQQPAQNNTQQTTNTNNQKQPAQTTQQTTTTKTPTRKNTLTPWIAGAAAAATAITLIHFYTRRRNPKTPSQTRTTPPNPGTPSTPRQEVKIEMMKLELDERDKAIIEALKEKDKTASELMEETGIPKTPLYRRLRKLIDAGIIDYYEENGTRKYRLKTREQS